jgi:hypothetical protein
MVADTTVQQLCGALLMWLEASRRQLQRMEEAEHLFHAESDAITCVIHLDFMRATAHQLGDYDWPGKDTAAQSCQEYLARVPGLREVRNILEHLEKYRLGQGHLQIKGRLKDTDYAKDVTVWCERGKGTAAVWCAGTRIDLSAAVEAGGDMTGAILTDVHST